MVDYILLGHGIAGISLSEHLLNNGHSVLVLDSEKEQSSSMVAAGLYNPITGRVMKKTWLADMLFPYLEEFYQKLESTTASSFFHDQTIYRPFASLEEQNDWFAKGKDEAFTNFIKEVETEPQYNDVLQNPYGGLRLKRSGFVDLPSLKKAHREHLMRNHAYQKMNVDESDIFVKDDYIEINGLKAKNLIFCDGPLSDFSYFNWLPTAPVKGELIHIELKNGEIPKDLIFNRGVFILKSTQGNYYRVGATYEWKNLNNEPTEKARDQLISKLDKLLKSKYHILDQVAGVRPATKDRKPLIGTHPEFKNVHIFNGLGTKGVSLAPYFANQFTQHLQSGSSLIEEVNISRYYSLY